MFEKVKKDIDLGLDLLLKDMQKRPDFKAASPILYEGIKNFVLGGGKRIRPLLFVLSYLGYAGQKNIPYKKLIRASASLELLHDFLLIHDDVIDNSALRRGRPTLHRFFNKRLAKNSKDPLGPSLSIVSGDIIFALAAEILLSFGKASSKKDEALKIFLKTAASTGTGEFIDVYNNMKEIDSLSEKDIYTLYVLKTSKYTFEAPLVIGAVLAGADKAETKKLSRLGTALGQAFQIQDDLLDIFSSSKKIGKPVLSDLAESKKTLAVWKAYNTLKGNDKKSLKHLLEKEKKTYTDLLAFRSLIKVSGAEKYCKEKASSLFEEADRVAENLKMKPQCKTALRKFIGTLR